MRTKVLFLLLLLIYSSLILTEVKADKEPNNNFSEAEKVDDGSYEGNVSIFGGMDVDVFKINLHRKEKLNISIALLEMGHLQLNGYYSMDEKIRNLSITLMKTGEHRSMIYSNGDVPKTIYLKISGNSVYRLNIRTSMNPIKGFISDNLNITLIFFGIAITIFILVIIVIFFFIRTIKLSISNGFETKECEEGKKVSLVDKRFRHDCMAVMTDDKGVERMMPPDEAKRFMQTPNIKQFRLERMDVDYRGYEE